MDLGLNDAATVVIGGGRGMGVATARCLAEERCAGGGGRSQSVLDAAAEDLTRRGSPDALGLVADIRDVEQVDRVFAELGPRWNDELNVLINAVGPGSMGSFEDLADDQWRAAVDEGVMGMVHCVRAALPLLRQAAWGRIVNFSAHSTQRQSTILVAYTAAKAMVNSVSKNLSLLLATTRFWSTWYPRGASPRSRWSVGLVGGS